LKSFDSRDYHVTEIISGEDIGYFTKEEASKLKNYLSNYFSEIVVVIYLRSPVSYIQSAFQELVKHGLYEFNFTYCDPDYKRFKYFSEVFGFNNMIFRNYDEIIREKRNVVEDFTKLFGIKLSDYVTKKFSNSALSLEAVSFLYVYQIYYVRPHDKYYFEGQNSLINVLKNIGDQRLNFSPSAIESVINENQIGIEFIKSKYNIDFLISNDNNDSKIYITCENDLISCAITYIDILIELLSSEKSFSIKDIEVSEIGVSKLMHALDLKVNGPIAAFPRTSN
jgi:hypothetical protein